MTYSSNQKKGGTGGKAVKKKGNPVERGVSREQGDQTFGGGLQPRGESLRGGADQA